MAQNVEQFALDLLDLTHPEELETLLVKGPSGKELETVTHAVELERKNFVASANFQVVLSPKWYGKSGPYLNKLRRMNVLFWYLIFLPTAVLLTLIELPLSALIYTFYPGLTVQGVRVGDLIRIPFIKFINHMASQMTFLFLLMQAASTSANRGFNRHTGSGKNHDQNYDLLNPSLTEWWICIWVMGMVWNELKQVHTAGLSAYFGDLWNRIDATMIVLYFSTLAFRAASYLTHQLSTVVVESPLGGNLSANGSNSSHSPGQSPDQKVSNGVVASTSGPGVGDGGEEKELVWQYWDLLFLSEGVFALANIFSFMRLVTLATLSQHIGPMQISLSRMVKDVMKFMFIFFLVLLSFACGLHQLNWFFKTDCKHYSDPTTDYTSGVGGVCRDGSDKKAFDSLLMAMRTLFWALFNLSPPPNNIETSIPNNKSTPIIMFIVEAMYASYYVTAVIVLLRMLVAMMTTSYRDIESRADIEWKYARSKLWMTYIEQGSTLPPPVNLMPSMKWVSRFILQALTGRFWKCDNYKDKDTYKLEEQRRKDEYNYRRLIEKLIGRYRKEKARVNLIYPEETEEIGKSIVVLHTENRRLVSLIQRLTKDSEEHAKNWYYDYNVRNQAAYLNDHHASGVADGSGSGGGAGSGTAGSQSVSVAAGVAALVSGAVGGGAGRTGGVPGGGLHHLLATGAHQHHQHHHGVSSSNQLQRPASSIGGLTFASTPYSGSLATAQAASSGLAGSNLEGANCGGIGASMKPNSLSLQNTGNHCNYNLQLAGVNSLSPTSAAAVPGGAQSHQHPHLSLLTSHHHHQDQQGAIMGDEERSLIHRYNGQAGRQARRLFQDTAEETEEIIVETDLSSCDSPVRQIFCQSGSSLDEEDDEEDPVLEDVDDDFGLMGEGEGVGDTTDEARLISPHSVVDSRTQSDLLHRQHHHKRIPPSLNTKSSTTASNVPQHHHQQKQQQQQHLGGGSIVSRANKEDGETGGVGGGAGELVGGVIKDETRV
ncbi:transient receptor potential-gamma protein-like isoform X2 [Convolutriloba macropyga]|uniref:transient receptor potential-gamma protein-like isoform X2 n=1 Tax=Convolutriloba macropyga TaxID=536237 RepID=UPI003F51E08E